MCFFEILVYVCVHPHTCVYFSLYACGDLYAYINITSTHIYALMGFVVGLPSVAVSPLARMNSHSHSGSCESQDNKYTQRSYAKI